MIATYRLSFAAAALALTAAPALAQLDTVDPSVFVGAPLLSNEEKYELTKAPEFQFQGEEYIVIAPASVRPTSEWTVADSQACTQSGGIEVDLAAQRKTCLKF